jgi:hypothetical protein
MSEPHSNAPGYEVRDVNFGGIYGLAGLTIVSGIMVLLGVWWLFHDLRGRQRERMPPANPLALEQRDRLPPHLEGVARMKEKAGEAKSAPSTRPNNYGWVDRQAGIVRVPVDRAMNLIVEQKLVPSAPGPTNQDLDNPYRTMPSPANSGRGAPQEQP